MPTSNVETERHFKEKCTDEQSEKRDRLLRLRNEKKRANRLQGPLPHNNEHKLELLCDHCLPVFIREKSYVSTRRIAL
jgi:hypothetical protein